MKWFIKVLRHYADFSGRARRTEYWMFALFNAIFTFALVLLLSLFAALFEYASSNLFTGIFLSYFIVMMLPSMAVTVRRLHDLGKSGWMVLVGLIPVVGGIWLFILMLMEGQNSENKYGDNPKTSQESFSEQAKLKSAGITIIIASIALFLLSIIFIINVNMHTHQITFLKRFILDFINPVLWLITGILLLNNTGLQGKGKNAIFLLLAAAVVSLIFNILTLINYVTIIQNIPWTIPANSLINAVFDFSIALFALSILSSSQNKSFIRNMATVAIIFSIIYLLWRIFFAGSVSFDFRNYDTGLWALQNMISLFIMLFPISCIILAETYISIEQQKTVISSIPDKSKDFSVQASYTAPRQQSQPAASPQPKKYPLYTGTGVCDVCNRSLSECKAYIVANNIFYNSRKYRDYIKNSVMGRLMSVPINDAYFAQMQAQDHSQGSAVCESCIHMFE